MTSSDELPAPTNSDPEWAEWQVGKFTVASGGPVYLYVEIGEGPVELPVADPVALAHALLAAHKGQW